MQTNLIPNTNLNRKSSYKKAIGIKLFLISIPFMLYIIAFSYVPIFGWIYSLYEFKPLLGINLGRQQFVGFTNFMEIWKQSEDVIRVLRNTVIMGGLGLLTAPLPVVLAILLTEIRSNKFKKLIQTTTTFPNFISWIVVFGIAYSIFSSSGMISMLIRQFGGIPSDINLIGDINHVWSFQVLLSLWKHLGWSSIIYVATISGIDQEQYEAAKVDGANRFQSIIHITIPGVSQTFIVMFLLAVSFMLSNGFDQFFVFNNSIVSSKIQTLDLYTYQLGVVIGRYSYSIAFGIVKTLVSISLLFSCNAIAKKLRGSSLF